MKAFKSINIKSFYVLTKPGIVYGNAFTAAAGILFASTGNYDLSFMLLILISICLIMAGACVLNNMLDVEIDIKMERTARRPLVTGEVSKLQALVFGSSLVVVGLLLLAFFTNWLTFLLGIMALLTYAPIYTQLKKRTWVATWVGGIPGALPPVAGYTAVINRLDENAIIIFVTMFVWQMAHFYAIALFRKQQYKAAGVPVVSVVKGEDHTAKMIMAFIVSYTVLIPLLTILGSAGYIFSLAVVAASIWWFKSGLNGIKTLKAAEWGATMFGNSLRVLIVYSLALAFAELLP